MIRIVLAGKHQERLADLAMGLWTLMGCELYRAVRSSEVLTMLNEQEAGLVIVDEQLTDASGLDVAREVARCHPFVDCIMVDAASAEDFHEKTEGLGVLLQLPSPPRIADAYSVVSRLADIKESMLVKGTLERRSE